MTYMKITMAVVGTVTKNYVSTKHIMLKTNEHGEID